MRRATRSTRCTRARAPTSTRGTRLAGSPRGTADTLRSSPSQAARGGPQSRPDKLEVLRREWDRLTDTHQFLRLVSKLKMNRLGAYRIAGAPLRAWRSHLWRERMLESVRDEGIHVMLFVGNRGCIQIHSGPVVNLKEMGPWQNILDPRFDLHLRRDHIAEVWAVEKPTQRGPALSVEAFDAEGSADPPALRQARLGGRPARGLHRHGDRASAARGRHRPE
jgi:putative heme degradation protein